MTEVSLNGGVYEIRGLTSGEYRYKVQSNDGFWSSPSDGYEHMTVPRGGSQVIPVDLSSAGSITVLPILPNGELYDQYLTMMAGPGLPSIRSDGVKELRSLAAVSVEEPPYVFPLVKGGDYTLKGLSPRWSAPADDGYLSFRVTPGQAALIEVNTQ